MRYSIPFVAVLVLCFSVACDKKKASSSEKPAVQVAGPLGAEESKCKQACEKGPRFHFEEARKAELRRKPKEEHAKIKAAGEERWKAMEAKHQAMIVGCVKQCVKAAKPGEVDCLIAANNMAETQACVRKFKSRAKGAQPKRPSTSTTRSKDTSIPRAVKGPKVPVDPKNPTLRDPSVGLPSSPAAKGAASEEKKPVIDVKNVPIPRAKAPSKAASPKGPKVKAPVAAPKAALPKAVAVPEAKK